MNKINRRTVLSGIAAMAGAACTKPPATPANVSATTPAGAAPAPKTNMTPGEPPTRVLQRPGILIKFEGLMAFSVLKDGEKNLAVDALLIDAKHNPELALHAHIPTLAIPREIVPEHIDAPVVDMDYAYWPLAGRTITINAVGLRTEGIVFDHAMATISTPRENEVWRSTAWLADLNALYKGYKLATYHPSATVKIGAGAEFEPRGIVYGEADKANGLWALHDAGGKKVEARAYKHSTHVLIPDPRGISIGGLLSQGALILEPGNEDGAAVRIMHLPSRAMSKEEIAESKDARAYADLLTPEVPIAQRLFPVYAGQAWRTDECGCCPQFRLVRDSATKTKA